MVSAEYKAAALLSYFRPVYVHECSPVLDDTLKTANRKPKDLEVTTQGLASMLRGLVIHKPTDPAIPKPMEYEVAPHVPHLFTLSLSVGNIPGTCRTAEVLIHKGGTGQDITNNCLLALPPDNGILRPRCNQ